LVEKLSGNTQEVQTYLFTAPPPAGQPVPQRAELVLLVSTPQAQAGYDSRQMIYTDRPYQLDAYAHNQWADTPARMLQPLLIQALEHSGAFSAVVTAEHAVFASLRLDTEVVQVHQEFEGESSLGRVVVRAQLMDANAHRVLRTRTFEATEPAPSADPYGGVTAINRALGRILAEIAAFCVGVGAHAS
jgi:cholesterol transport system auxiliary component